MTMLSALEHPSMIAQYMSDCLRLMQLAALALKVFDNIC